MIDRRVELLLDSLREGGAFAIAAAATERLVAMNADDDPANEEIDDGGMAFREADDTAAEVDGGAPDDDSTRRDPGIALRQLEAADEVVLGRLRLEAALIKAIPDELRRLREAQVDRGDGAGFIVDEVVVIGVDDAADPEDRRPASSAEQRLVDGGRMGAIEGLARAWSAASDLTRESIREGG